jgi:flagellar biogenesis protein FliO
MDAPMDTVQNLMPLIAFFVALYWFFRWVVHDMNRQG